MESTFHVRLEMQSCLKLKDISPEDAKLVFAYRTRMAKFSENFRGPHGPKMCGLCQTHLDNQQMAFNCPVLKPKLDEKGKYEYIFRSEIPSETITNLKIITRFREENMVMWIEIWRYLKNWPRLAPMHHQECHAYDNAILCFVLCFELDEIYIYIYSWCMWLLDGWYCATVCSFYHLAWYS